jgi:hypothetical protein
MAPAAAGAARGKEFGPSQCSYRLDPTLANGFHLALNFPRREFPTGLWC